MEHIKNIEIKNFKSIRHAEIKDCRRVNVFIGYPNVGKSNILEALGLLTFIRQKRPIGLEKIVRIEKLTQIFNYFNIHEPAVVKFNERFSLNINYEDEDGVRFNLIDDNEINTDYNPGVFGLRVGVGSLHAGKTNDIDNFSGRFNTLKNFQVKPYKFFSPEKKFDDSFSALELRVPRGENMVEVIINNSQLVESFSELLKQYGLTLIIDRSGNEIKISPAIKDGVVYTLPLSLIADTLIRLMFHKTAISTNRNTVLLFEEPEAHMFPPYMRKFTSDVIFDKTNQFFIATHSPYVLGEFIEEIKEDLSVYVVDYDKGETIIKRLTDDEVTEVSQYGIDLFFNLESYLDKYGQPRSA